MSANLVRVRGRPMNSQSDLARARYWQILLAILATLSILSTSSTTAIAQAVEAPATGVFSENSSTVELATALNGASFIPGMIISDTRFYDRSAMTQAEIQTFLDAKIGTCANGRCLNVLVATVASRPQIVSARTGNVVCEAFTGGTLTAAAIIYRSQIACGISAKVILVTLQKEQGLVTKTAPTVSALDRAMGMACPDTAACAPEYLGFGNQVYEGTRQLMTYKAGRFAKQPGVQSIGFHPNTACGSTSVNVQNYATAALYSYTPYQPNAAALANLGGTGDSCSSYGNRNFWVYYNNWFGPTAEPAVASPDRSAHLLGIDAAGELWTYPPDGRGGLLARETLGAGWGSFTKVVGAGDFDGDGHRDVLVVNDTGILLLYPTDGDSGWLPPREVSQGWLDSNALISIDFNGDRSPDLLSRDAAGRLWFYANNGRGVLGEARQVGNGWQGLNALLSPGDFNGDGKADVLARDSAGKLWNYRGNGRGGWLGRVQIGNGWSGFNTIFSSGDFTGDGKPDVLTRDGAGNLRVHPGNGVGGWLPARLVGTGWDALVTITGPGAAASRSFVDHPGAGDLSGDGARDVLTLSTQGTLKLYPGNGRSGWLPASSISAGWGEFEHLLGAGDINNDGNPDFLSVDQAGVMLRYSGDRSGHLSAGEPFSSGWEEMNLVLTVGDFDGDRIQDLVGRDAVGNLWLYSGDGVGGLGVPRKIGNGWNTLALVFSAGDFDGDGNQDVMGRTPDGVLWLYPGNGAGGWQTRRSIGSGWNSMTWIYSPGDFSGDGNPDVLARTATGTIVLYRGNGAGGWLRSSQIGNGWGGFTWIG
jgi:FG-GAP-like repeat